MVTISQVLLCILSLHVAFRAIDCISRHFCVQLLLDPMRNSPELTIERIQLWIYESFISLSIIVKTLFATFLAKAAFDI